MAVKGKKSNPEPDKDVPAVDEAPNTVTVVVPKNFLFSRDDGGGVIQIKAGVQEMSPEMAAHWWCKANGVTIYDSKK